MWVFPPLQQLFRVQLMKEGEEWDAAKGKALVREIPEFSFAGTNTVVLRARMTTEFTTFMLNITPDGLVSVLGVAHPSSVSPSPLPSPAHEAALGWCDG